MDYLSSSKALALVVRQMKQQTIILRTKKMLVMSIHGKLLSEKVLSPKLIYKIKVRCTNIPWTPDVGMPLLGSRDKSIRQEVNALKRIVTSVPEPDQHGNALIWPGSGSVLAIRIRVQPPRNLHLTLIVIPNFKKNGLILFYCLVYFRRSKTYFE
jgi:hypothetical protein